ncbi:MAG: hypothetical protein VYE28_11795 [Planctomycetota bacterium]|nr:hypothetical protein [Planctomycetota bacterium]
MHLGDVATSDWRSSGALGPFHNGNGLFPAVYPILDQRTVLPYLRVDEFATSDWRSSGALGPFHNGNWLFPAV